MIIRDNMKSQVFSIHQDDILAKAAKLFLKHNIGTLPVVDSDNKLVGVLTLQCLLRIVMPDFVDLVKSFRFLHNLGAVETRQPEPADLHSLVKDKMQSPFFIEEDCSLLRAAATFQKEGVTDLPVVTKDGILVGLVSHVDIGTALIKVWDLDL